MALTEWNCAGAAFDSARPPQTPDDTPASLARLQALHGEAGDTLVLAQLLGRAPQACVVLMLAAPLALIWTGTTGGTGLKAGFAWSALLILGLVAMIRLHIRGFARSLRRTPSTRRPPICGCFFYIRARPGAGAPF